MKKIELTQGQSALVDDEDFEQLSKHKWSALWKANTKSFYAVRNVRREDGSRTLCYMHREILKAEAGHKVDHENHNTLDNQRANLRLTTTQGNAKNQRKLSTNTSGANGVSWDSASGKWRAYIRVDGVFHHLGFHTLYDDAVEARAEANKKHGFHENHGSI